MTAPSPDTWIAEKDSEQRIAEIRARLAATTAATDVVVLTEYDHGGGRLYVEEPERKLVADFYDQPDRDFYANAPADIAYLLAALDSIPDQIARAVEAERAKWTPTGEYYLDQLVLNGFEIEREACASLIERMAPNEGYAAAIRARGVKP